MSLPEFVDEVRNGEKTLTVFAGDDEGILDELERFFEVQNTAVRRGEIEGADAPRDFAVLHEGGDAVAVSTLEEVRRSIYLAGGEHRSPARTSLPEGRTPDVVASLDNTTFAADGRDGTLLTQVSHHLIELAFATGGGTLHVGTRRLSSVSEDPCGSDVYAKPAAAGVDVHLYGVPDADVDVDGAAVHGIDEPEIRGTRFLAFDGAGDDGRKAAMVAVDPGGRAYRGFWTFETALVDDVVAYLETTY